MSFPMGFAEKFRWYLRRLSVMYPGEILFYRPSQFLKTFWEKAFLARQKAEVIDIPQEHSPDFKRFFIDLTDIKNNRNLFQSGMQACLSVADALLNKRISLFSHTNLTLDDPIDWHKDYSTGKRFPVVFGKNIDYRDSEKYGDIKYVWELNRHIHLVPLAKAYYFTENERYRDEVIRQIDGWIKANPYLQGVNWCSSLEIAIRLIQWCWVYHFLVAIKPLPVDFLRRFFTSVYHHCRYISRHYSAYSSANNHLIGEAAGLFIATTLFEFLPHARTWNSRAQRILEREIVRQTHPDGVNKEQAIDYHCFSLEFFMLCFLLNRKNGLPFSGAYSELFRAMFHFLAAVYLPEGGVVPQIGDSDNAVVLWLDQACADSYRSILNCGAILFDDAELKTGSGELDEKAGWLLGGASAIERFREMSPVNIETTKPLISFESGGYHIFNVDTADNLQGKLIFDTGDLGYLSLAAHGHADALSFVLLVNGREIITDPGTYVYHTEHRWRDYFRSTAAHNTIEVEGENQSVIGGAFLWLKKAHGRTLSRNVSEEAVSVSACHDGYKRLSPPAVHKRTITWLQKQKKFEVTDVLEGRGILNYRFHLHLAPNVDVVLQEKNVLVFSSADFFTVVTCDENLHVTLEKGTTNPRLYGWYSRTLGTKIPVWTIIASGTADSTTPLKTYISFSRTIDAAREMSGVT